MGLCDYEGRSQKPIILAGVAIGAGRTTEFSTNDNEHSPQGILL